MATEVYNAANAPRPLGPGCNALNDAVKVRAGDVLLLFSAPACELTAFTRIIIIPDPKVVDIPAGTLSVFLLRVAP